MYRQLVVLFEQDNPGDHEWVKQRKVEEQAAAWRTYRKIREKARATTSTESANDVAHIHCLKI